MFDVEIWKQKSFNFITNGQYVYGWNCTLCKADVLPNFELYFVTNHARTHTKEFHNVKHENMQIVIKEVLT